MTAAERNAARENARLVLNYTSSETPGGRAARLAAEDVLRLLTERRVSGQEEPK